MNKKPNLFFKAELTQPLSTDFSKVKTSIYICFSDESATPDGRLITEQAINSIIRSLPNTPIVGDYNPETEDFSHHVDDEDMNKGRFGVVPSQPNARFEERQDGHQWLTSDIVVWTQYPGGKQLFNSSISIEINEETVQGHWEKRDGKIIYVFTYAELKAISALGKNVEPGYPNAKIEKPEDNNTFQKKGELELKMKKVNFQKSLNEKYRDIMERVEKGLQDFEDLAKVEENKDRVAFVEGVYDNYLIYTILEFDHSAQSLDVKYFKADYSLTDDSAVLSNKVAVRQQYLTAEEESTIDNLRKQVEQFELDKSEWNVVESEMKAQIENFEKTSTELNEKIADLEKTLAEKEASIKEFSEKIENFEVEATAKTEALNQAKEDYEKIQKEFESVASEYKKTLCNKYKDVFEKEELDALEKEPVGNFKNALGQMLVDKDFGVNAKILNDFAALIPNVNHTENLPEWALAVKNNSK